MARKQATILEVNMQEKFQIMHFLDGVRWQKNKVKFYPNFAYPNTQNANVLNFDEMLLTHWLLYITDRQMSFRQIWDKGGFVFSEIAQTFTANKNIAHLTDFQTNFTAVGNDGYQFQSTIEYGQVCDEKEKRSAVQTVDLSFYATVSTGICFFMADTSLFFKMMIPRITRIKNARTTPNTNTPNPTFTSLIKASVSIFGISLFWQRPKWERRFGNDAIIHPKNRMSSVYCQLFCNFL